MNRLFLVFVLVLVVLNTALADLGEKTAQQESSDPPRSKEPNYDEECDKRYDISKKKRRIKELESKLNRFKSQQNELKNLRSQNEKLKDQLKTSSEKASFVEQAAEEEEKRVQEYERKLSELGREIKYQESNSHVLLFNKICEVFDLLQAELSIGFYSILGLYEQSLLGGIFDSFVGSLGVFSRNIGKLIFLPMFRLTLKTFGHDQDTDPYEFLKASLWGAYSSVKNWFYFHIKDIRESSILRLRENPRISYLAEEVVDLGLLSLIFFAFLVIVSPIISYTLNCIVYALRRILSLAISLPLFLGKQTSKSLRKLKKE